MKLLLKTIFIFIATFIFLFFLNYLNTNKIKTREIIPKNKLQENITENKEYKNEVIDSLNLKNNKIKNIIYEKIIIKSNGISTTSSFYHEKNKKLRMITNSVFGKESDVGSNNDFFWFCSNRLKYNTLFYAKHEDLHKTRLKTIFHPTWIMETIGINTIDNYKESEVFEQNNNICIKKNKTDITCDEPIIRVYLIDKNKKCYFGHYLYDRKNFIIVSFEVIDYYKIDDNYYPKEVNINWAKENLKSKWKLSKPKININIDENKFIIPFNNFDHKINLDGYCPDN